MRRTSPLMLSVAIHCLLTRWLVLSTRGASILQLHRGSSSSRSVSPASLPSADRGDREILVFMMLVYQHFQVKIPNIFWFSFTVYWSWTVSCTKLIWRVKNLFTFIFHKRELQSISLEKLQKNIQSSKRSQINLTVNLQIFNQFRKEWHISILNLPLWGESVRLSAAAMSRAPKGTSVYSACLPSEDKWQTINTKEKKKRKEKSLPKNNNNNNNYISIDPSFKSVFSRGTFGSNYSCEY